MKREEGSKMAPKVRALRRPAMAGAVMRRPAHRGGAAEEREEPPVRTKKFADMDARELVKLQAICLPAATYYGRKLALAGKVQGVRSETGEWYLDLLATGTKDEELLRSLSGRREKLVTVHLCGDGCTQQLTDELLVHAPTFEESSLNEEAWMTNLQEVRSDEVRLDEMRDLRLEQERMEKEKDDRDRRAEKKEDKKKRKETRDEGRTSKSPRKEDEELEVGQKGLEDVFKDTGMDPNPKRRAKVLKKARQVAKKGKKGKKKKEKASSSSSKVSSSTSSSSSEMEVGETGIFEDDKRLTAVWRKCPGALSARSIQEIKRNLLTAAGTTWDMNKTALPPVYTQYCRQVVMPGMGASLQQEVVTVAQCLDHLAQGRVAACMDILNQRLKSLEALGKGGHWTLCPEEGGMTEEQEKISAARQAREEERLRNLMSKPPGGKGTEYPQGGKTRKGKDSKGSGKGQPGESGKNRGGQGGKDESKAAWQKK